MASETNTKQKVKAHVPVTVTILIPIEIEADVILTGDESDLDGCIVVDALKQEGSDELIADILAKAVESPLVEDALGALMAGAHCFKKDNPEIKALYTPYLGIVEEKAF